MAQTPLGNQLTLVHGAGQRSLVDRVVAQMLTLWALLDPNNIDATSATWLNFATQAVLEGRSQSDALAAGYLRAFYAAEVPGHTPTIVRAPVTEDLMQAVRTSLEVTGPVRIKQLTGNGYSPEYAAESALKASQGTAQRHVADGGRETVIGSAQADPVTMGWRRVIVGDTCPFCRMLADRGAIYTSDTVRFAAHDRDDCVAEPAIAGEVMNLRQYEASKRKVTKAEKERLKDYLHEHYDGPKPRGSKGAEDVRKDPGKAPVRDVDAGKSRQELQAVYDALAPSYERFPSPGTKKRLDDLAAKIAAR